ncbi:bud neck involved protein [Rhinocladiella similis]
MAALVQTLPAQTTTVTMIGRPSSSGGYPSHASQGQMRNHAPSRYNNVSTTGYRGVPGSGPIAPYAFTSTPQLAAPNTNARSFAHNQGRSRSSPSSPPETPTNLPQMDFGGRPLSLGLPAIPSTGSLMGISTNLAPPASSIAPKPSPDRYRRTGRRADGESHVNRPASNPAVPSGSGMAAVGSLYKHPAQSSSTPSLGTQQSYRGSHGNLASMGQSSADDLALGKSPTTELAARYRRRSFGSIETAGLNHASDAQDTSSPHPNTFLPSPPAHPAPMPAQRPTHKHTQSSDSVASSRSTHSSRPSSARANYASPNNLVSKPSPIPSSKSDQRLGVRSPRSGDSSIRQPSPLSRPANLQADDIPSKTQLSTAAPQQPQLAASPAVEQLAALNQKSGTKSKSKLRRAFSFGSAAELRKATTQGNHEKSVANRTAIASKRNSKYEDELEPEQAKIAEKQEAAGLGESIYSGQGHFFTGSTDNLSISSTASSASVMLRKMGKGVKKGTRSLVGLFRPKSVVGVPAADGPVNQASLAQVSMITVEAEREKVNINVNPHDQTGGGTGFPKLERNSIETKLSFDSGTVSSDTRSRRSIVGGEKERAEVLAAVKKGILKRADSNQASPKLKTYDFKVPDFSLPQIPHVNDSPKSSAPSTPADETPRSGHRRTDSITIENNDHDDYFSSMTRFVSPEKENPMTPQSLMRNISFSPRLQFYDTWPSGEYDRRGEIATCNRLTPMLAQQIKEELNTFKMEMEVHESSKVYTHFF